MGQAASVEALPFADSIQLSQIISFNYDDSSVSLGTSSPTPQPTPAPIARPTLRPPNQMPVPLPTQSPSSSPSPTVSGDGRSIMKVSGSVSIANLFCSDVPEDQTERDLMSKVVESGIDVNLLTDGPASQTTTKVNKICGQSVVLPRSDFSDRRVLIASDSEDKSNTLFVVEYELTIATPCPGEPFCPSSPSIVALITYSLKNRLSIDKIQSSIRAAAEENGVDILKNGRMEEKPMIKIISTSIVQGTTHPTSAPTVTASSIPSSIPSKSPISSSCEDSISSKLPNPNADGQLRGCEWVKRKKERILNRCNLPGFKDLCPLTCNSCDSDGHPPATECKDTTANLILRGGEKKKLVGCAWVARKSTNKRCGLDGVKKLCPKTCNACIHDSSIVVKD